MNAVTAGATTVLLSLMISIHGCSPQARDTLGSPAATIESPQGGEPNATPSLPTPTTADAGNTPEDLYTPGFEQEMACRKSHCYPEAAKHCFDTCYKYNHPRDPQTHDQCNASCRSSWDIDACEQACALDLRAFRPQAERNDNPCLSDLAACRRACPKDRSNTCEHGCLCALRSCEETSLKR